MSSDIIPKKRQRDDLSDNSDDNSKVENEVRQEVISLCSNFPIYKNLNK